MEVGLYNGVTLAYIGDSVYELEIRNHLVLSGITKVNALHKRAILYTSALAQAKIIRLLLVENQLSEEEIIYYKRGRNAHVHLTRKHINLADYLDATGFESLLGYLYLAGKTDRIEEIMQIVFQTI